MSRHKGSTHRKGEAMKQVSLLYLQSRRYASYKLAIIYNHKLRCRQTCGMKR
ncbi:hypothetical protein H9Q13_16880 [Pontibacter sp. JH31]|uniref:Uncharacterized protein n=1 Tax=Pontibacter aquaedesilientis TaxID=2766980 RepID=A0ABR7XMG5_9BACT|nr:hypothetical protein [Pontibacter aquaedesilientis]